MQATIEQYCDRSDLSTADPYDVWKTRPGFAVKGLFVRNRLTGLIPAAAIALFDTFINNRLRLFYRAQEYPIVRAMAAMAMLNLYGTGGPDRCLVAARRHLRWLAENPCTGYHGRGWGVGFAYWAGPGLVYDGNTPFTTVTPYVLEAFVAYGRATGDTQFDDCIRGVYQFLEKDVRVLAGTDEALATSYGPMRDRIVNNAISYTAYSYCLLLPYIPQADRGAVLDKVRRLYAFIRAGQRPDGSWLYSPQGRGFIDCFHSCIVLKNLVKAARYVPLSGCGWVVMRGRQYLKDNFLDQRRGLVKRFSLRHAPSLVKFDLYDNAEMMNLAILTGDRDLAVRLARSIRRWFCRRDAIYSQIDLLGIRRNKGMLRWAVMPYLLALSEGIKSGVLQA